MIETIYIKNFLSFREPQEVSFVASNKEKGQDPEIAEYWYKEFPNGKKILKLLFLVGENGAGKSNILASIDYLRAIAITSKTDRRDSFPFLPFLLDNDSRKNPSEVGLTYFIGEDCYSYKVEVNENCILSEELKKFAGRATSRVYLRKTDVKTGLVSIAFGQACDLSKASQKDLHNSTLASCSVLASFWAQNIESSILLLNYKYFSDQISLVHPSREKTLADKLFEYKDDDRIKALMLQLLRDLTTNIIDYEVTETVISLLDDVNVQNDVSLKEMMLKNYPDGKIIHRFLQFIHKTTKGEYKLGVNSESVGTIKIIRLMIVIYDIIIAKKSSFIDEIERGIHTKALQYIIKAFLLLSRESQLVVSTHDLHLLDMPFMRRDSVRKVTKDQDGISNVHFINQNSLHRNSSLMNRLYADVLCDMPDLFHDDDTLKMYTDILYGDDELENYEIK